MTRVRGLWSVNTVKFLCWIASLMAISSLSKAEYFFWACDSFLEKKPKGLPSSWARTAPMAMSDASVVNVSFVPGLGCASKTGENNFVLLSSYEDTAASVQTNLVLAVFAEETRAWSSHNEAAIPGRNW